MASFTSTYRARERQILQMAVKMAELSPTHRYRILAAVKCGDANLAWKRCFAAWRAAKAAAIMACRDTLHDPQCEIIFEWLARMVRVTGAKCGRVAFSRTHWLD